MSICCCFGCCCCFPSSRVQPVDSVLDIKSSSSRRKQLYVHDNDVDLNSEEDGEEMKERVVERKLSTEEDEGFSTGSNTENNIKSNEVETNGDGLVGIEVEVGVTAMHAAAVNGNKPVLAKLLAAYPSDVNAVDRFSRTPLIYAVLGDRIDCADLLLRSGADIAHQDAGKRTPLHWAAHKGNVRCLRLLLSKGANMRSIDCEGNTAVHLTTRHQSPKCLNLFIKQLEPGEVDAQNKKNKTALHIAASYGYLSHVRILINQGSNIGILDDDRKTPLHYAVSSKSSEAVDCVRLLLDNSPSVLSWQDFQGRTALHLAIAEGNEDVAAVLIESDSSKEPILDNEFRTPLHWAAVLGHTSIVARLLEQGLHVCSSDSNGATPLHYAARNNFADTVEVFLSRGIADDPDIHGRTAFMWAASRGADLVIQVFLKYHVDVHVTDSTGSNALHAAAYAGHTSTVSLLLDSGSLVDATDDNKYTALIFACQTSQRDVARLLIKRRCRIDICDRDGRTPLHWAALQGDTEICLMLIKTGINANARDYSGRSPLQCASYGGYVNCMSVLLDYSADPNAQDNEGMTPLHWACSRGCFDAVKLLMKVNADFNNMEYTEDRYTPLDYALIGKHEDIAHYLIEQGALTITGIQDLAAARIQAVFKGYHYRKINMQREKLLMEHERLLKNPTMKRIEEEKRPKLEPLPMRDTAVEAPAPVYAGYQPTNDALTFVNHASQLTQAPPTKSSRSCQSLYDSSASSVHKSLRQQTDKHTDSGIGSSRSGDIAGVHRATSAANVDCSYNKANCSNSNNSRHESESLKSGSSGHSTASHGRTSASKTSPNRKNRHNSSTSSRHSDRHSDSGLHSDTNRHYSRDNCTTDSGHVTANSEQQRPADIHSQQKVHQITLEERQRLLEHRVKNRSAATIQKAWRRYSSSQHSFSEKAFTAINEQQNIHITDEEWRRQIAALTIQLAWRKHYRRKLMQCLTGKNRKLLRLWHPSVIAEKQRALVQYIYGEHLVLPDAWHPQFSHKSRPTWFKYLPSPAALSYNFAVEQYKPHRYVPTSYERYTSKYSYSQSPASSQDSLNLTRRQSIDSVDAEHFSYNLNKT